MPKFRAILVEDEPSAASFTSEALEAAGFDVVLYEDALSAQKHADSRNDLIDLLVLDRRLPLRTGEPPRDAVGDDLLTAMLLKHPDLVAIVFSGHTGFEHHQFATAERGVVSMGNGTYEFDRVRLFQKGQSLEFDAYVAKVAGALSALQDIQILGVDVGELSPHDKRVLRRVAFEMGGSSVTPRALTGGMTDSAVWLCLIEGQQSAAAHVVVKRHVKTREPGGFQTLCPAQITAGTVGTVRGFCGGYYVTIQQLVGADPTPLFELIVSDESSAVAVVKELRSHLAAMPAGQRLNVAIDQIAAPFSDWDQLVQRASARNISVPPSSRIAATTVGPRHGDLHAGNVLVAAGRPVVIDFDSQTVGSPLVDVLTLQLGMLFHSDSPIFGGDWPTPEQCSQFTAEVFLEGCPAPDYFSVLADWIAEVTTSPRELAAVVLGYAVRQLKYADVLANERATARATALARWAAEVIDAD